MVERAYKVSPTGKKIVAVCEEVLASAGIEWNPDFDDDEWGYVGESKIHWDTQEARKDERGQSIFEDENGDEWPEDQLLWNDEFEAKQPAKEADPEPPPTIIITADHPLYAEIARLIENKVT